MVNFKLTFDENTTDICNHAYDIFAVFKLFNKPPNSNSMYARIQLIDECARQSNVDQN